MSELSTETREILEQMRKLALSKNDDWQTLPPTANHSEEIFELEK